MLSAAKEAAAMARTARPSTARARPRTARQRGIYSEVLLLEAKPTQKLLGPTRTRELCTTRQPRPLSAQVAQRRAREVPALMLETSSKYAVVEPKVGASDSRRAGAR